MAKRFVVFTVITGGFDTVKQPRVLDPRFDYVLFTDSVTSPRRGIWSVREIKYDCKDLREKSRFPKIHPEVLLSEYELRYILTVTFPSLLNMCMIVVWRWQVQAWNGRVSSISQEIACTMR